LHLHCIQPIDTALIYSHRHVNPYTLMTITCILMPTQGRKTHLLDVPIELATAIEQQKGDFLLL
jgi:hypothetical protein